MSAVERTIHYIMLVGPSMSLTDRMTMLCGAIKVDCDHKFYGEIIVPGLDDQMIAFRAALEERIRFSGVLSMSTRGFGGGTGGGTSTAGGRVN